MQDKEKIREKYGPEWARLPPAQQDEIIDRCLVGPSAPAPGDPEELARFPGLRGPTGQKVVRFGDEVGADGPASPPPLPDYTRRPRPGIRPHRKWPHRGCLAGVHTGHEKRGLPALTGTSQGEGRPVGHSGAVGGVGHRARQPIPDSSTAGGWKEFLLYP